MNTEKLDKLIDNIFSEMGEIERGKYGFFNQHGEKICFGLTELFVVTENVPHLNTLEKIMDPKSFKYVMDEVGNRLFKIYTYNSKIYSYYSTKKGVSYFKPDGRSYIYGIY